MIPAHVAEVFKNDRRERAKSMARQPVINAERCRDDAMKERYQNTVFHFRNVLCFIFETPAGRIALRGNCKFLYRNALALLPRLLLSLGTTNALRACVQRTA
jgi:hypothetical protein